MRGYCWRAGCTVELDGKCPECGGEHEPIPDQALCAAYSKVTDSWGVPCILPYGHEGPCTHIEDWARVSTRNT